MVDNNIKRSILDFKAINKIIFVLRIKTMICNISFINVHALTEEKKKNIKGNSDKILQTIRYNRD